MRLSGKVAIITGAGNGIGRAIAIRFAAEGAKVALWDLRDANSAARDVTDGGGDALPDAVDVSNEAQVREAVSRVLAAWGKADILVNSAGICPSTEIDAITSDEWGKVFAVNVWGAFCCSRAVASTMRSSHSGCIVNLTSQSAKTGGQLAGVHYCASKAAIMNLTFSLARILAADGIRVNGIAPGIIDTDMIRGLTGGDDHAYDSIIPIGRMGSAAEVASAAAFLASDDASYITGEVLDVNGGQHMD